MGLFRRKKNLSIEELNKINEERWKTHPVETALETETRILEEANVDPEIIKEFTSFKFTNEGYNVDKGGKEYWACGHHESLVKFETKEDYVAHHMRAHG